MFGTPLASDFWLRNGSGGQTGENRGIVFCFNTILYIPGTPLGSEFWLRNGSGAQTMENHGIDRFLLLQSYTFLAPLSDRIFGSAMAPEPKREENHGIDTFLFVIQVLYISGTPLGSDFWLRNGSGAQTGGQ